MSLSIRNLTKAYVGPDGVRVPIVDVASFDVANAEQVALIGSSGSGKTTLLHLIAGILAPDSGQILFGETGPSGDARASTTTLDYLRASPTSGRTTDVARLSEAERDVFRGRNLGYVFQTHHLLAGFTALENVLLGMSFTGRRADRAWAEHLLVEVGLRERLHYRPAKLSVGQQQRVAIARALANRPKLVLADEPTGALDAASAQQALDLIRKLCTEVNASLILVTHDLAIARQLGRTVTLHDINAAAASHRAPAAIA